nr:MAG TPA: Defensin-1, Scorpion, Centruroides limpidus limpidus [Caudoviricetes sp.]
MIPTSRQYQPSQVGRIITFTSCNSSCHKQ